LSATPSLRTIDEHRFVATVVVVALLTLAGCAGTKPTAEVVCAGCERAVEDVEGVTVEESVTHVYLRESIAAVDGEPYGYEGYGYGGARPAFRREDLDVAVEGAEVVVTYRARNVTQQRLGATFSAYLFRDDPGGLPNETAPGDGWEIGTDRLVVHGPAGTEPALRPENAAVEGDTLVWSGDETVGDRTYLLFDGGGPASGLRSSAVLANEVFLWASPLALLGSSVPMGLLLILAGGFGLYYPGAVRDGWNYREDNVFWVLAGLSLAVAAGLVGFGLTTLADTVNPFVAIVLMGGLPVATVATFAWWYVTGDPAGEASDEPAPATAESQTGGGSERPTVGVRARRPARCRQRERRNLRARHDRIRHAVGDRSDARRRLRVLCRALVLGAQLRGYPRFRTGHPHCFPESTARGRAVDPVLTASSPYQSLSASTRKGLALSRQSHPGRRVWNPAASAASRSSAPAASAEPPCVRTSA
jgi:hypothetical protein